MVGVFFPGSTVSALGREKLIILILLRASPETLVPLACKAMLIFPLADEGQKPAFSRVGETLSLPRTWRETPGGIGVPQKIIPGLDVRTGKVGAAIETHLDSSRRPLLAWNSGESGTAVSD